MPSQIQNTCAPCNHAVWLKLVSRSTGIESRGCLNTSIIHRYLHNGCMYTSKVTVLVCCTATANLHRAGQREASHLYAIVVDLVIPPETESTGGVNVPSPTSHTLRSPPFFSCHVCTEACSMKHWVEYPYILLYWSPQETLCLDVKLVLLFTEMQLASVSSHKNSHSVRMDKGVKWRIVSGVKTKKESWAS